MVRCPLSGACYLPEYKGEVCRITKVSPELLSSVSLSLSLSIYIYIYIYICISEG